ncbi:MAG TPA: EamA family transporter [Candidatus Limnocylindria bacterium]|nr:EamA family transporter [Candidatus Limnocylindria bacterium]
MPPLAVSLGYVLLIALWGSTWAAIKIGVEVVPPFVFAFQRALAVSVILTALSLAMRHPFPRDRRVIAAAAVVGIFSTGTSWAIIFWSEQYVPSGLVSVFGASSPVWTAFLAHFFVQGDRLSATKVIGLVLGMAGIAVLVGAPDTTGRPEVLTASVLLAAMPITWAIGTVLQVRMLRHGSPLPLVAIGTSAGTLVLLPLAAAQSGEVAQWNVDAVLAFGYLVLFGSCVGLVLQMWLMRRLRPTTMTLAQVVIPAQALLIGALALGENITWRMLAGAALVVAAVALNAVAGGGTRAEPVPATTPAD